MNKKGKYILSILLIIFSITIIDINLKNETYSENLNKENIQILELEKEIEYLKTLKKEKENQLYKYKNEDISDIQNDINSKYKYFSLYSGHLKTSGPGIRILLFDNLNDENIKFQYDMNSDVIHDNDVINIINDLKIAKAEAISINGHRLNSKTEIICGGPIIRINKYPIAMPFVIEAIGEPEILENAIKNKATNGYIIEKVLNKGLIVKKYDKIILEVCGEIEKDFYNYFSDELEIYNIK